MPNLRVTIGDQDVTGRHNGLSWSNVARGGMEAAQLQPGEVLPVKPGDPVRIWVDNECVFWGDVNDPGDQAKMSQGQALVVGVGPGRVLKENPYREIYVDRDLGKWGDAPAARVHDLTTIGGHPQMGELNIGFDDGTSPIPANHTGAHILWHTERVYSPSAGNVAWKESWYDAQGIPIGALYYDYQSYDAGAGGVGLLGAGGALWLANARIQNRTNTLSSADMYDESADLADGTGQKTGYVLATALDRTYGSLRVRYGTAAIASDGSWATMWRNVAVYGAHGLARQGSDPGGFYPHQIVVDALRRVFNAGILAHVNEATTFILRHYLADNKTPEAVIDDMAKFMGWYWGVWAPSGFDTRPRLLFHPPRPTASCSVRWSDCRDGEAPRTRLDLLYDQCRVTYQDPSGKQRYVTVAKTNPFLDRSRRMEISMAVASESEAKIYGQFALALSQSAQRGSGWAILPEYVDTQMGRRPSATLQAGRDRLRVVGLPLVSNMLERDTRSGDTFHIQKVECVEQGDGSIQTRVEFDGGADLLDTLQLRAEEALIVRGAA